MNQDLDPRWKIPSNISTADFDWSWRPDPYDPPYIHQFGTQWQKTGGPQFIVDGATDVKYHDYPKATAVVNPQNRSWRGRQNIEFDFSWHHDETEPPFIYQFGTQWQKTGGPRYVVKGATQVKYIEHPKATSLHTHDCWEIPEGIDVSDFDFSWHPDFDEPPMIYQFGTQWQKTGGPRYVVEDATHIKYMDFQRAKKLPDRSKWTVLCNIDDDSFDWSWHPDDTEPPFIYQFGNNLYTAEEMPTVEYRVSTAHSIKFVHDLVAVLNQDRSRWYVPDDIDTTGFNWDWMPDPKQPPFIYQFGTQWQKTGGPRYTVPGASEVVYLDTQRVTKLPNKDVWTTLIDLPVVDFDWSWHPDNTEPPMIYQFGNNWYSAEEMPTLEYRVDTATTVKFVNDIVAQISGNKSNWQVPDGIDTTGFNWDWMPDPKQPPFIYQFGTQWQKTGGPRYVVPGATEIKYVDTQRVTRLPDQSKWKILSKFQISSFDWSWHPDDTEPPFIYQFGNNWYSAEEMPTIEWKVKGAKKIKFVNDIVATIQNDKSNWHVPDDIDATGFNWDWMPDPKQPPMIYQFGTQWQKTGGPRYVIPGASEVVYVDTQRVTKRPSRKNWKILHDIDETSFDWSWHPDDTEPPLIYAFGNQYRTAEETPTVTYVVPHATEMKYCSEQNATIVYRPLDIIFLSNGEFDEERRFDELAEAAGRPLMWVRGIKGRESALRRAAELSTTDWFFLFPGKLCVNKSFDFSWQPNRFHDPKHYIFYATNPVNGLEYGHMAAVAYNKHLVLDTIDYGLDFTMSKPHDVVPVVSGIAEYNLDPLMTWRTAFREAIKLKVAAAAGDKESKKRLAIWTKIGNGKNSEYSLHGASEGVKYYKEVDGDPTLLQLSFDWDWLESRFHHSNGD